MPPPPPPSCDEVKPECGNCLRFSMHCDFAPSPPTNQISPSPTASSPVTPPPRKRGRPRKDWDAVPKLPASNVSGSDAARIQRTPAPSSGGPTFPSALNSSDLELQHHYMCHTAITLGESHVWREHVPKLGFKHHYMLHMVLAISAQHLARLRPAQARHYETLAERHSTSALPAVASLIPRLDKDNCQALYHTTVLVCFSTFAKKPTPGHLLAVAEDGEVPWWGLMRGVRIVVQNVGIQTIISGLPDESVILEQHWTHCPALPEPVHEAVLWETRLEELADLVATTPDAERDMLTASLGALRDCFRMTFGTEAEPEKRVLGRFEIVMRWLYNTDDDFVARLQQRQALPLILLGHFAVLLQLLEHFWFMEGWAEHLLNGLFVALDPQYATWLEWPAQQIRRTGSGSGSGSGSGPGPGSTDRGVLSVQRMID
ncbi:Sterol uptake control protein 2 [Colletotrichum shisoi]|uniref:Sterol uptake control protein 2 n=1 Tax=Colletotrichum shisoi TaxID=2078593 RepID=A0A5Q4BDI4_9PEZI|nr:Sterol uptake control protein 2 [Colletotrichum shisoi]